MSETTHRFTVTLNRPQGARIFNGTAKYCRSLADALYVVRELLHTNEAFEPDVTSLKITISPARRKKS